MVREIPGTIDVEGREFFYVQFFEREGFRTITDKALSGFPGVPMPKDGGVIEEKARLLLDDGPVLLGVSYKGDLAGWRGRLIAYCKDKGRLWGIASNGLIALSDGRELQL